LTYKSDLDAAHSHIITLEHELESLNKDDHHCDGCKCNRESLWTRIKAKRCACGNPLYACVSYYIVLIVALGIGALIYFLTS